MKTKIKRHSRSVISVLLAVCMLVSCMTVGLIATDAAKVDRDSAVGDGETTYYLWTSTVGGTESSYNCQGAMAYSDGSYTASIPVDDFRERYFFINTSDETKSTGFINYSALDITTNGDLNSVNSQTFWMTDASSNFFSYRTSRKSSSVTSIDLTFNGSDSLTVSAGTGSGGGGGGESGGGGSGETSVTDNDLIAVLKGTKIMIYFGDKWGSGTKYVKNGTSTTSNATSGTSEKLTIDNSDCHVANGYITVNTENDKYSISNEASSWAGMSINGGNDMTTSQGGYLYYMYNDGSNKLETKSSNAAVSWTTSTDTITEGDSSCSIAAAASGTTGAGRSVSVKYYYTTNNTNFYTFDPSDTSGLTAGTYTIYATAYDTKIHVAASTQATLTVEDPVDKHAVTISADPPAGGTVTGGGDVREGTNATIEATPNPGYVFSSWDIDGESNKTNPYTFNNVTAAHTAVAHFSTPTFNNITIQTVNDSTDTEITGQNAATAGATSGTVESNISVKAKEIANMTFVGWTSEKGFFNNDSALSTNFHPTADDAVIVAHYREQCTVNITAPSTTEGKIVVTDASGNVVTNGQKVGKGTELTITATPKTKYKVTKITVNGTDYTKSGNYGAAATQAATVSGDTTISAAFQKDLAVKISVISNDNNKGTVAVTGKTLASNKTTAQIGETLTLVATPKSGNGFVGWAFYPETAVEYVDGKKSTDATTKVKVKAGFYAEATFAEASTAPSMSELTEYTGNAQGKGVWAGIHTGKEGDYTRQPLYYKKISDSQYDLYIHLNVGASNDFANHQIQDGYLIYLIAGKDDDDVKFDNTKYTSSVNVSKNPSGTSLISEAGKENKDSKYAVKFKTNKASEVFIKVGEINNLSNWDLSSQTVVIYPVGSTTPITPTPSFNNTHSNIIYAKNGTVAYDKDDASKKNSGATSEYGTITVVSGEALDVDDVLGLPGYKTDGYEGHKMYYYDDAEDSSIKVRVTMNTTYKTSGYAVHGFVVNGETFEATEGATDGVYEGVITIPAGTGNVEITPVYYNKTQDEAGNYFKFYVNPSNDETYKTHWGETVALYTWYGSDQLPGDGTYPGQPLLKDGSGKLYALVAKAYIDPATGRIDETKPLNGLLLDNYYENEHVHRKFMTTTQQKNYQTYDYKDLVKIRNLQGGTEPTPGYYDVIEFDMKYKANSSWNGDHQQADYSGVNHSDNSKLKTDNISDLATKYTDWEDLKDYDGHTINLIGENIEETKRGDDNCLYVVVAGNQNYKTEGNGQGYIGNTANNVYKEAIGEWATVWIVYDWNGNYLMQAPPSYFIANSNDNNPFFNYIYEKDGTSSDLLNYRHTPVKISYELEDTAGNSTDSGNTGIRLDGRWLYSSTKEPTQAHIRVAKKNNDGTLAFFDPTDLEGATSATGETAAGVADMTNKDGVYTTDPNYDNRTTTASLRANIGNGYKFVEFVKMKSTASADGTLKAYYKGYSSTYADYDKIPSEGSGHDMTIDTEYYIVAIVAEVPNTDLHITHEKYAGPDNHGGLGYYYVSFSGTDANGDPVTYTNVKGASGILIDDFTSRFPYENNAEVTITITTRMAGTNVFVDWFKNNNKAYERLVSPDSSVYGSNDPVSYAYKVKVRDLYNADHTYLAQNTINFYSDIDSVGKVNIDHKLLSTSAAKGTTKNQVKVISEDGSKVVHDYGVSESLTSVGSTYMKANSTNKLQITLTLGHESAISTFRGFYLDETPTEMTTQTVGDIDYVVDAGNETATITIPISYFFIVDDETGEKVFDASKKDIIYYSALDLVEYKYSITYTYKSYENLYGNQTYSVTGTFTQDDIDNYLTVSNEVKNDDDQDNLTTALWFKDDNARKAFLNKLGPYENNYREKLYWNTDLKKDNDDNGVGIKYQGNTKKYIIDVNTNEKSSKYVNLYFKFPYNIDQSKDNGWKAIPGSDGKVLYTPAYKEKDVKDLNYMSWWAYKGGKDYSDPENLPQFVTAPSVIYDGDTALYFRYWTVKTVPTDVNPVSVEYTKCYSREFNLAIMQDTIVEPVFTALTEKEIADNYTPSPHAEAMKSGNATGATITFLENSRNQWNNGGGGNAVNPNWKTQGDRMYTDFVLSFASESDIQYKTYDDNTYKAGLIIEKAAELDIDENGDYVTKTEDEYHSMYDARELTNAHTTELEGFIEGNTTYTTDLRGGYKYQKAEFDANTLDNKNRIEYYYSMSVRSHSDDFVDNGAKNYVYRAYSYIKNVSTGKVELLSKPVYFTIYDMASITNAQEGLDFDKITT